MTTPKPLPMHQAEAAPAPPAAFDPRAAPFRGASAPEKAPKAYFHEIFLSFQGEGVLTGVRQIFLRLAGCDIRCPWCDTPDALVAKDSRSGRVELAPNRDWKRVANPVEPQHLVAELERIRRDHGPVDWVAITGGEPTIWRRFLGALCPALTARGFRVYLETNSHHPEVLADIREHVEFVSSDLKLPFADYAIGEDVYRAFLRGIPADGQVKIVVFEEVTDDELRRACRLIAESAPQLPLILQPLSPTPGFDDRHPGTPPSADQLLRQQQIALEIVRDVRIVGQAHKMFAVR